jgi:threonine dehydrogenase-like Zn-dependent dehydrogenase
MGSRLYSSCHVVAVDLADSRLDAAQRSREDPGQVVMSLTGGLGADVAIEAVGVPSTVTSRTSESTATRYPPPGGPLDKGRDDHDWPG